MAAKALGALRVERWLRQRAATSVLRLELATAFHRIVFGGVFPEFAGRVRGPAPEYLPVNVDFGPFRAVRYEHVPAECDRLFETVGRYITQLDALRDDEDLAWFDEQALKVAAFTHCELIRIHPFRNGNGRTARLCVSYFAWRYGMLPIPFERPKGEYTDAVATWLRRRVIAHFEDFLRPQWRRPSVEGSNAT
jgi:fido (protein-threonine AMPylation protein)